MLILWYSGIYPLSISKYVSDLSSISSKTVNLIFKLNYSNNFKSIGKIINEILELLINQLAGLLNLGT